MTNITSIKKDIAKELGLEVLPREEQEKILNDMAEALLRRVFLETFERLEESDREALLEMLDADAETEKVEKFIQEKIPDYNAIVEKVMNDFKEGIKGSMAFAKA